MNLAQLDQTLVGMLDGRVAAGHPRACGYAAVPAGTGWQGDPSDSHTPYLAVWPTESSRDALLLSDPHSHLEVPWVIKAVSVDPDQAKRIADDTRAYLATTTVVAPSGLAVNWQRVTGPRGPYPDHDTIPPLFVVAFTVTARLQSTEE